MKSITEIVASSTFWAAVGSIAAAVGSITAVAQIWRSRARRRGQARSSLKRIVVRRVTNYATEEAKQAVDLQRRHDHVVSRHQAIEMLRFVYDAVYGDSYLTQGEADREYRAYVARLRQEAESGVSYDVRAPCGKDFVNKVRDKVPPPVLTRAVEAASPL